MRYPQADGAVLVQPCGMFDERCELPTERCGVLLAQIDLVFGTAQPEPHSLCRRASIKIVLERDGYLLCHPGLPDCDRLSAPYKINCL
jgi:hypothetical protein